MSDEYRDAELARWFANDPVPGASVDFWDELETALAAESVAEAPGPGRADRYRPGYPRHLPRRDRHRPERFDRRWGRARWLSAAAAVVVVAGLAGAMALARDRSASPIDAASPTVVDGGVDEPVVDESDQEAGLVLPSAPTEPTTTSAPSSVSPPPTAGATVDYFTGDVTVTGIGSGRAVGFSPDDSVVLMVDDATGGELGCEGAPLLALYAQDLATGLRKPALGPGSTIQTGGVDLVVAPFGPVAAEVETRPVYWTEWCDGERWATSRGILAADGTISMVEDVDPGGGDDPFAGRGSVRLQSPDRSHVVQLDGFQATVFPVGETAPVATLSLPAVAGGQGGNGFTNRVAWSPRGDVVGLVTGTEVWLWNPWTDQRKRFDTPNVVDLVFDSNGRRLAVTTWNERQTTSVLTFDGLPDPVPATGQCSGATGGAAGVEAAALGAGGLPGDVAATAVAIDRAAATCDWTALGDLLGDGFTASFGGGGAIALWQDGEGAGRAPMRDLRAVLASPWARNDDIFVWPSVFARDDCDWSAEELRSLAPLGEPDELRDDCESIGGYSGYRVGIDDEGSWRFFVAGD